MSFQLYFSVHSSKSIFYQSKSKLRLYVQHLMDFQECLFTACLDNNYYFQLIKISNYLCPI